MKTRVWLACLTTILIAKWGMAQELYDVNITIQNRDQSSHIGEQFFITGAFNGWKPAAVLVGAIPKYGETIQVTIPSVPKGLFEYKFTRGNWETLASTAKGNLEGPIKLIVTGDTAVTATIDGWRDDFPASTASPQVHILDSAFYFPKLDVQRRVWIYLPEGYAQSKESYPVIYMHDGQDLFDEATSKGRIGPLEWRVDEAIDEAKDKAIVVAIAHAEDIQRRQNEYFVRPTTSFPQPLGEAYLQDIVSVLKPYVDQHYRTKSDRAHTAMAGSSVGGLLTFYASLLHPETFGTVGVLSPSIWLDEGNIDQAIAQIPVKDASLTPDFYFYGGGNENRIKPDGSRVRMHDDIERIIQMMQNSGREKIQVSIEPDGRHGAWYWQKAFPYFYSWWTSQFSQNDNQS
ncbi:alpha/beta hydrolase [Sphingobacterium corticibacter]|nr:alpha/beta hydrolase-fold protein [Sphingobacterium corticibacter]